MEKHIMKSQIIKGFNSEQNQNKNFSKTFFVLI